jgi:hypothetical protein
MNVLLSTGVCATGDTTHHGTILVYCPWFAAYDSCRELCDSSMHMWPHAGYVFLTVYVFFCFSDGQSELANGSGSNGARQNSQAGNGRKASVAAGQGSPSC